MTILEALQSLTEYENTNLLSKVLSDTGLEPTDAYVSSLHKDSVASASADLYDAMAQLPEFKEGHSTTKWDAKSLRSAARSIRLSLGIGKPTITGNPIW